MRCVQWGPSPTTEGHGATPGENDPSAACTLSACEENVKLSAHGISARVAHRVHDLPNGIDDQFRVLSLNVVTTVGDADHARIRQERTHKCRVRLDGRHQGLRISWG